MTLLVLPVFMETGVVTSRLQNFFPLQFAGPSARTRIIRFEHTVVLGVATYEVNVFKGKVGTYLWHN